MSHFWEKNRNLEQQPSRNNNGGMRGSNNATNSANMSMNPNGGGRTMASQQVREAPALPQNSRDTGIGGNVVGKRLNSYELNSMQAAQVAQAQAQMAQMAQMEQMAQMNASGMGGAGGLGMGGGGGGGGGVASGMGGLGGEPKGALWRHIRSKPPGAANMSPNYNNNNLPNNMVNAGLPGGMEMDHMLPQNITGGGVEVLPGGLVVPPNAPGPWRDGKPRRYEEIDPLGSNPDEDAPSHVIEQVAMASKYLPKPPPQPTVAQLQQQMLPGAASFGNFAAAAGPPPPVAAFAQSQAAQPHAGVWPTAGPQGPQGPPGQDGKSVPCSNCQCHLRSSGSGNHTSLVGENVPSFTFGTTCFGSFFWTPAHSNDEGVAVRVGDHIGPWTEIRARNVMKVSDGMQLTVHTMGGRAGLFLVEIMVLPRDASQFGLWLSTDPEGHIPEHRIFGAGAVGSTFVPATITLPIELKHDNKMALRLLSSKGMEGNGTFFSNRASGSIAMPSVRITLYQFGFV